MIGPRVLRRTALILASAIISAVAITAPSAAFATAQGTLTLTESLTGTGASGSAATVASGSTLNLALNYDCSGADCADSTITVPLPSDLSFGTPTLTGDVASWTSSGSTVTFTMNSTVPAGSTGQIVLPVTVPAWTTADGPGLHLAVRDDCGLGLRPRLPRR